MEKQYLDYNGLANVAGYVNTRLKTVTTMPVSADNGAVRLYVGTSGSTYEQGHIYQYNSVDEEWVDITPIGSGGEYKLLTGTLLANAWSNNTQIVTIQGISSTTNGVIGLLDSATSTQIESAKSSEINVTSLGTNSVSFVCKTVPAVDIPFGILIGGGGSGGTDENAYHIEDTAETSLADDDYFPFYDTSVTATRKSTWANIKAKLTTFFNTIYSNVHVYVNPLEIYNTYIGLSSGRQRISIDTGQYTGLHTINGTSYIEQEVTLGTTDTTVTFDSYWVEYTPEGDEITHYYFNDNTIVRLFVGRNGSDVVGGQNQFPYKSMYIANNALTIVFPALSSAVNVKVRAYIDNYE